MGLRIEIYRSSYLGDCTNKGISAPPARSLTLVNVKGPDTPHDDAPPARLEQHRPGYLRIVPDSQKPDGAAGPMMGGNFAHTSDSRFHEACEALIDAPFYGAVAIHDRFEF